MSVTEPSLAETTTRAPRRLARPLRSTPRRHRPASGTERWCGPSPGTSKAARLAPDVVTMVVDPDATLLDALRAGDDDAFASLVSKYHARLLRFAESMVPSRAV